MKHLVFLAIAGSITLFGAEPFSVTLTRFPRSVLPGTMIRVEAEAKNVSGKPVTVANISPGFVFNIEVRRADGKPVNPRCNYEEDAGLTVIGADPTPVPADWHDQTSMVCQVMEEPGTWIVRGYVKAAGELTGKNGKRIYGKKVWEGVVYSESAEIEILAPQGVDKGAYEEMYIHRTCTPQSECDRLLLDKYPTSMYAGYVLASIPPVAGQDIRQEAAFDSLVNGDFFKVAPKMYDPFGDGRPMLDREAEAHKRFKLLTDFLNAHPDFPDAHKLTNLKNHRLLLALALHRFQDADDDLAWLEKHGDDAETRSMARGVRTRMRTRGLIAADGKQAPQATAPLPAPPRMPPTCNPTAPPAPTP